MYKIQDGKMLEVSETEMDSNEVSTKLATLKDMLNFKLADRAGLDTSITNLEAEIVLLETLITDAKAVGIEIKESVGIIGEEVII